MDGDRLAKVCIAPCGPGKRSPRKLKGFNFSHRGCEREDETTKKAPATRLPRLVRAASLAAARKLSSVLTAMCTANLHIFQPIRELDNAPLYAGLKGPVDGPNSC